MSQQPVNDNKVPKSVANNPAANPALKLTDDELFFAALEQMATIAHISKLASEIFSVPFTESSTKTLGEAMAELFKMTRGYDFNHIMARASVNIAAASQSKHIAGIALAVSKQEKEITMKAFYGPGANDFNDLVMTRDQGIMLRDALHQAVNKIEPEKKLIMPDNSLIQ